MNPREHPDIKAAELRLREAEHYFPSLESARMFMEGFTALSDVQEQGGYDAETSTFATNLKLAYTRSVLDRLHQIDTKDFETYVHYYVLFLGELASELSEFRARQPEIAHQLDQAQVRFGPQLDELIRTLRKRA